MNSIFLNNSYSNFNELEEYGEFFINEEGVILSEDNSNKLSSIYNRVFEDSFDLKSSFNNFSMELLDAILNTNFEFGILSNSDNVFNSYHDRFGIIAFDWLSKLFISNIFDSKIVLGILLVLSRQKLLDVGYQGQIILITTSFQYKNDIQIQEAVIRCIENWESFDLIHILDKLNPNESWLIDYKNSVIADLKPCPII